MPPSSPSRRRGAFTTLELMVALTIVALVAAIAVPSFRPAMNNTFDRTASLQLEQLHRLGWSNASAERRVGLVASDFDDPTPGSLRVAGGEPNVPSTTFGQVSVGVYGDGTKVALAMRSRSGSCVGLVAEGNRVLESGKVGDDVADCRASTTQAAFGDGEDAHPYVPPAQTEQTLAPVLHARQTLSGDAPAVSLAWEAGGVPGGVAGYRVERDGEEVADLSRTAADYLDTEVEVGQTYVYQVTAYSDDDQFEAPSPPVSQKVYTFRAPVVQLHGESPSLEELRMVVGWSAGDAPGGTIGYDVWRDGVKLTPTRLPASQLTFTDEDVEVGPTYSYQVVAHGADGSSLTSEAESGFVEVSYELTAPTILSISQQLGRVNRVSWQESTTLFEPVTYTLYTRTSAATGCANTTGWTELTTTTGTTFDHVNVDYGSNYRYCVRAEDSRPSEPKVRRSDVRQWLVTDIDPPAAPTITSTSHGLRQMGVSWSTVTDHSTPITYEVWRMSGTASCSTSGSRTYNSTTAVTSTTSPLAVPNSSLDTSTRICVRAIDGAGNASEFSSTTAQAHTFTDLVATTSGSSIQYVCGIRSGDLTAWCWGSTHSATGIIGMGTGNVWAPIRNTSGSGALPNIRRLAVGAVGSCAIVSASSSSVGSVYCLGRPRHTTSEDYNALGRNTLLGTTPVTSTALVSGSGSGSARHNASAVSVGDNFGCFNVHHAHVDDRETAAGIWCFGRNSHGQLGNGTRGTSTGTRRPVKVSGSTNNSDANYHYSLDSTNTHSCSMRLSSTGNVRCWGAGTYGRRGDNSTAHSGSMTWVCHNNNDCQSSASDRLYGISGGTARNRIDLQPIGGCARNRSSDATAPDRISCWGAGFLGRASGFEQFNRAVTIGSGYHHSSLRSTQHMATGANVCSRRTDGTVRCGGHNRSGQLGRGNTTEVLGSGAVVTSAETGTTITGVSDVVAHSRTCTSLSACESSISRTHLRTSDGLVWRVDGSPYRARKMTVWMPAALNP